VAQWYIWSHMELQTCVRVPKKSKAFCCCFECILLCSLSAGWGQVSVSPGRRFSALRGQAQCKFEYIHIRTHTNRHMQIHTNIVFIQEHTYRYWDIYVCICVYCMYHACILIVSECICMYLYIFVCIRMYVCIVCICWYCFATFIYVCICMYLYVYVYIDSICMYMYVYVRIVCIPVLIVCVCIACISMCLHVCMEWVNIDTYRYIQYIRYIHMHLGGYICTRYAQCICVCIWPPDTTNTYMHFSIHTDMHTQVHWCRQPQKVLLILAFAAILFMSQ
jgi:hypothetical protein